MLLILGVFKVDGWQYKFGLPGILKGWYMIFHQGIKSQHAFQAALYLGLRQMEWLFLTCHNYWIVLRLVKGGSKPPFLAFSPLITMEDFSVPFRAFLGAILSVVKGGVVEASVFDGPQGLDTIEEEAPGEEGPAHISDDGDDCSGPYTGHPSLGPVARRPPTRAHPVEDTLNLTVRPSCSRFYLNHLKFISIGFIIFPTVSSFISSFDPCSSFAEQYVWSSTNSPLWQTTSLVNPLSRSWFDWQCL